MNEGGPNRNNKSPRTPNDWRAEYAAVAREMVSHTDALAQLDAAIASLEEKIATSDPTKFPDQKKIDLRAGLEGKGGTLTAMLARKRVERAQVAEQLAILIEVEKATLSEMPSEIKN